MAGRAQSYGLAGLDIAISAHDHCISARVGEHAAMVETPRVDFVTRKWPPAMGGMETYSVELVHALAPHAQVDVIALPGKLDGSVPGVGALVWFGVKTGARLLFARAPGDVIHVGDMASWPFAALSRLRKPRAKRVISAHGTDVSFPLRGGIAGKIYGAYLSLGARLLGPVTVLANSAATARQTEAYGYRDVAVVPLAAEVDVSDAPTTSAGAILFSGRLVRRKGCRWFIDHVLPHVPEGVPLHVAGTVWDEEERAALDSPRVTYLGRLDQGELWRRQRDALCVIVPNIEEDASQFEGFGLVAVEAAAAGGVVLAARHGGIVEAVQDHATGFLLTPGDAAEWAAKIGEVAGWSEAARNGFIEKAQATCASHYSWARVARDTAAHYPVGETNAA